MAIMLITHAMGVVAEVAQRVVVMYAGKVVEEATVEELFANPRHPYTQGLIRSIPRIDTAATAQDAGSRQIPGTVPRLIEPAEGCRFAPRCNFASRVHAEANPPCASSAGPQGGVHSMPKLSGRAMNEPLLRVRDLVKRFPIKGGLFGREVEQRPCGRRRQLRRRRAARRSGSSANRAAASRPPGAASCA